MFVPLIISVPQFQPQRGAEVLLEFALISIVINNLTFPLNLIFAQAKDGSPPSLQ